jgi:hypothetical protein
MDKKVYETLKRLRSKCANGTATFAERNWLKMQEKLLDKKKFSLGKSQANGKGANGPRH